MLPREFKTKSFLHISTSNRFKILAKEKIEDHETWFIGNFMVREQLHEFCGRTKTTRKRICMPGGRSDEIFAACNEATSNSDFNTLLTIRAGTNDEMDTRSEKLLEKYRQNNPAVQV